MTAYEQLQSEQHYIYCHYFLPFQMIQQIKANRSNLRLNLNLYLRILILGRESFNLVPFILTSRFQARILFSVL
jgi:hypothetical protein